MGVCPRRVNAFPFMEGVVVVLLFFKQTRLVELKLEEPLKALVGGVLVCWGCYHNKVPTGLVA